MALSVLPLIGCLSSCSPFLDVKANSNIMWYKLYTVPQMLQSQLHQVLVRIFQLTFDKFIHS